MCVCADEVQRGSIKCSSAAARTVATCSGVTSRVLLTADGDGGVQSSAGGQPIHQHPNHAGLAAVPKRALDGQHVELACAGQGADCRHKQVGGWEGWGLFGG